MIYFGWDGWGPWNTGIGSIWFFAGLMVGLSALVILKAFRPRGRAFVLIAYGLLSGAALGGYYGWFAGGHAQFQTCVNMLRDGK